MILIFFMFDDLNWDAFLSSIKNSSADSMEGGSSSVELEKDVFIDSEVRDIVDDILNSNESSDVSFDN